MKVYSGSFWDDKLIDDVDRKGRINRSFTMYQKYTNAICSPFDKSGYHAELEDKDGTYKEVQEEIDRLENQNNMKFTLKQGIRHTCITGVGFTVISFENNQIIPEDVRDVSQVALDPGIQTLDGSDAEQGAIVNFIRKSKAKRLYGDVFIKEDDYYLSDFGSQWNTPADSMPIVSYYEMNDQGTVDFYVLCGNKVVKDKIVLPISRIPIFRMCFNEIIRDDKVDYNGIVDMTYDLQFGLNLGYSTLLERANRSPKANFMMPAKALDRP